MRTALRWYPTHTRGILHGDRILMHGNVSGVNTQKHAPRFTRRMLGSSLPAPLRPQPPWATARAECGTIESLPRCLQTDASRSPRSLQELRIADTRN